MALPEKNRLIRKTDFDIVFKEGKAVKGSFLFIKFKKNQKEIPRFGFSIPKKVYPKAVDRNRLKRILSEEARGIIRTKGIRGLDIVVSVRKKEKENLLRLEFIKLLSPLSALD